jgi:hypothetical protein
MNFCAIYWQLSSSLNVIPVSIFFLADSCVWWTFSSSSNPELCATRCVIFALGPFVHEAADIGQEHTLNVSTQNMFTYTRWHHVKYSTILVESIGKKIHYRPIPTMCMLMMKRKQQKAGAAKLLVHNFS